MKLTKEQINHLSQLSRVGLTEDEKEKYSEQISDILDYVEQLNEVNLENVEPVSQITGFKNSTREDVVSEFGEEEKLIAMAPKQKDNLIQTKSVFEKK